MCKARLISFFSALLCFLTLAHKENIKPRINGIGNMTELEVEIGQNHSLKCEAFVGDLARYVSLYWVITNGSNTEYLVDYCSSFRDKLCMETTDYKGSIWISELHIINVSNNDIKYQYKCKLDSYKSNDERLITIKLKDGKEYDAYLSLESFSTFESEERRFALQTLAPVLEDYFGYKLCIFERDVVPGGALVDDMNSFLEKSRRLIIVLAKDFTSCKAMYELESGLYKAMVERKIKVILIELTLSEQSFQPESLQLLKMKSMVKWKGEKSHPLNSTFWKKIQYLMPAKPIKTCSRSLALKTVPTTNNKDILILNSL
ncbi:interleukin-18 receptor 1 isoform X2 [Ranitomeya variabilis]|uniref:interleukin-18 receptor 1 isoform X2 n=1 Tax=Ranitomeya variabilis TaxID=490064 RepID=UPI00405798E2